MRDWRLIEHKGVCCLMFSWAVGLKTHSVLYIVFFNASFDEYLSYVNRFIKSHCVFDSKLVWSRDTILSEDELTASNLWSGFASNISLSNHSINSIDFKILRFYVLIVYSIGFSWSYGMSYFKTVWNRGVYFSEAGSAALSFKSSDFSCS
jgi:hypothetical protein